MFIQSSAHLGVICSLFRNRVSEAHGFNELEEVKENDIKIGIVGGLTPSLFSRKTILKKVIADNEEDLERALYGDRDLLELLEDCLWESVFWEYPIAVYSNGIAIRKGYWLVHCDGATILPAKYKPDDAVDEFFPMLTRILNGEEVYPQTVLEGYGKLEGKVVGEVTSTIVKQISILREKIESEYLERIKMSPTELDKKFAHSMYWKYSAFMSESDRMEAQLRIINRIFVVALFHEGFENGDYMDRLINNENPRLELDTKWRIMLLKK